MTPYKVEEIVKLNRNCGCTLGWCTECVKWRMVLTQYHQDMMSEVEERADMEIYALENTLEKSKELSVAIGHKRVYERVKLIGEYKGKLEAWREIKEMLTEAQTIIKSK